MQATAVETWVRPPDDLVTLTVQRTPAGGDTAYDSVASGRSRTPERAKGT
jgi:hypothetical protein